MSLFASLYLAALAAATPATTEAAPAPAMTPATPAATAPAAAPATAQAATVEADGVVICKRFPAPTGSRIGKRQICKTKWQWDQEKADNASTMDKVQRNPGRPAG